MRTASASKGRTSLIVALLAGLIAALALAPSTGASQATIPVPDGRYGEVSVITGNYALFTVRNRRVRDLNFQVQVTCRASDSPTAEQRYFAAGADAPEGRVVPANGKLKLRWQERGSGRLGQISVELRFRLNYFAKITVVVPEERTAETGPEDALESCSGTGTVRLNRIAG